MPPLVLFVGGGTLGHITPAVAVARALQKKIPGVAVHFVCSPRGEEAFLKEEGYDYTVLHAPRLSWSFPWRFWSAYRTSRRILTRYRPSVIFSKGGYVSVPLCLAAHHMGIPIVLHESDVVMGRANRWIARIAKDICVGFPFGNLQKNFLRGIPPSAIHSTGNPVREGIASGSRERGFALTQFSGKRPVLLIMGGSQGAQSINDWATKNFTSLLALCDIIHITGPGKGRGAPASSHYFPREFAHRELPDLYAITDVAISRAGAGSIAELAASGIAPILIPLRGVANDHQSANAEVIRERNAALVVTQDDMDTELMNMVKRLIEDSEARSRLRSKISALQQSDASRQIADIVCRYLV